MARYTAAGLPDTTFGGGTGFVTVPLAGNQFVSSVAIQPNGKYVVAGRTDTETLIARFLSDGTLDTGFGTNADGLVTRSFSSLATHGYGDVVVQPKDGKIVAVGAAPYKVVSGTTFKASLIARIEGDAISASSPLASVAQTPAISNDPTLIVSLAHGKDQNIGFLSTEILRAGTKRKRLLPWT